MRRPTETTQPAATEPEQDSDLDAPLVDAGDDTPPDGEVDVRVLRRAVLAGVATFVVLAILSLVANAVFGGNGAAALVWLCSAFVVGTLVTAGWLVLGLLLDMVAGHLPSRRRAVWTALAFVVAFISPVLPAAALSAAAGG